MMPEERPWRGPCEVPCPSYELGRRVRGYNNTRAKILFYCLKLQRTALSKVLPKAAFGGRGSSAAFLEWPAGGAFGESPELICSALREVSKQRVHQKGMQSRWEALSQATELLIGVSRGVKALPSDNFWTSFHWAF